MGGVQQHPIFEPRAHQLTKEIGVQLSRFLGRWEGRYLLVNQVDFCLEHGKVVNGIDHRGTSLTAWKPPIKVLLYNTTSRARGIQKHRPSFPGRRAVYATGGRVAPATAQPRAASFQS